MAIKTRAELLAERKAAGAAGESVRCPACNAKQKPQADGLCISCGAKMSGAPAPKGEPDPATMRPDSAETKAAMATGALVQALKQEGFDVTLADAEKWSPEARASYEELVKVGVEKHGIPVLLQDRWLGRGKVPGATKPDRVAPDPKELEEKTRAASPPAVRILEQKDVKVIEKDFVTGKVTETTLGKVGIEPDPRQSTFDDVVKQSTGDLKSLSVLLGMLHNKRWYDKTKHITLRDVAKWEPGDRAEAARVLKIAIDRDADIRISFGENNALNMIATELGAFQAWDPGGAPKVDDAGSVVSATWGEEKFTPIKDSYSTMTVGPMTVTATVRPGETQGEARSRLLRALAETMEEERSRKIASFVEALRQATGKAKA